MKHVQVALNQLQTAPWTLPQGNTTRVQCGLAGAFGRRPSRWTRSGERIEALPAGARAICLSAVGYWRHPIKYLRHVHSRGGPSL